LKLRPLVLLLTLAASAQAAEITRVASSFEPNAPFGMFVDATYEFTRERGKITREWYQMNDSVDVSEMRYQLLDQRLNIDLHLGLYKDLEFHYRLPIVFQQDRSWFFAQGTDQTNSTIYNNCLNADGSLVSGAAPSGSARACQQTQPLFTFDPNKGAASYRSGIGDMTFGLAWAPLNQKKDESNPTWVIAVDYTAPMFDAIDPSLATSETQHGAINNKIHKYKFSTSISKRVSFAEPYFQLHYTLPWLGPGYYSNCDHPSPDRMALPQNCGHDVWTRSETGIRPPHVGGFIFGTEINAYDEPQAHRKFAIDARAAVTYVSEGRYYNEMSDLFGKLLYTSDYMQISGRFGIIGHAAEFFRLQAYAEIAYNTEHWLTNENIGKDFVVEPNGMTNGTVDVTAHPQEVSPNFDYRIDRVGRRFRIEEDFTFRAMVTGTFSF
jgi:hypothetical protein